MVNRFKKYNQEHDLFDPADKILLTVSGGKDSMVMLHLYLQQNLSFGVAHCNFQLRGEAANEDQLFVQEFCKQKNIPFHTIAFQTQKYATEKGISIQMAARDLRYSWFENIRQENNYSYIATAHHQNDVAETMLINLTKGTGLAGLHGISNKIGNVVRPLMCFTRNDIEGFVKEQKITFREDDSNADTKYTRNLIRHKVLPELATINPAIVTTLNVEAHQFLGDEKIVEDKIKLDQQRLFIPKGNGFAIEIQELIKLTPLSSYLFYFLRAYHFNSNDVMDIIRGLENQSGKVYYSSTHQLLKDRDFLLLSEMEEVDQEYIQIKAIQDIPFKYEVVEKVNLTIEKSTRFAYLDADKIEFPLGLRTWEHGDSFQPLGMKGKKKVSDFLIDNKISVLEKKNIKVLLQNESIIWLIGHRIADEFKITSKTKRALILSIEEL
jgi:tRNA(Ile)-lysidine synthase